MDYSDENNSLFKGFPSSDPNYIPEMQPFFSYDTQDMDFKFSDKNDDHLKEFFNLYGVPDEISNAKEFLGKIKKNLWSFEFQSTLRHIEEDFPLLIQCCPNVKSSLLSLHMFLALGEEKTEEAREIFSQLEEFLSKYDVIFLQNRLSMLFKGVSGDIC